jgi:hypothetical protein
VTYQFDKDGRLKAPTREELAQADSSSAVVVLDQGVLEDGSPYWAYVAVKPSKYSEFMQLAARRTPIRLGDYGAILKYGFDPDVPSQVREEMKRERGFDDDYLPRLAQEVIQAQKEFLTGQEAKRISDIVAMMKKQQRGNV